jgi:hypothetical protein
MVRRIGFVFTLFILLLTACAESAPTAGAATDFAAACDKANDGKRIAIVGTLRFPESYSGDLSMVLRMYASPDFSGKPVGVQTNLGTKANQVEPVPDQYTDKDLKVHLADGKVATLGTQVKVSGKVYFPLVGQDFDCGLENPLIESVQ